MKPVALVMSVALLSLAVGCGSDSSDDSAPTAETTVEPAPTDAATAQPAGTAGTVLTAQVSDPFSISLVDSAGKPVTSLEAGSYEVQVTDSSANHNFHLTGPGVEETTTVPDTTPATWTLELEAGTYTFVCDPHAAKGMKGTFTVT